MEIIIPDHLKVYLGMYGTQIRDSASQEPVGWGYPVIQQCGEENWAQLQALGTMVFNPKERTWHLITKSLTREEALLKYGPVMFEEFGPRGGWKSVTFGTTKFTSKLLKSQQTG